MATVTVNLSESVIRRHLDDPAVTELRDPRNPLRLRYNTARTGASWHLVRYGNGAATWKKIGNWPAVTYRAVLANLPDLLAKVVIDPASDQVTVGAFETVTEMLHWYRKRSALSSHLSERRKGAIASVIRVHLLPLLGTLPLSDLTVQTLDEQLVFPLQQRYALSYVRMVFDVLRVAGKAAQRAGMVPVNPLSGIKWSDLSDATIRPKEGRLKASDLPMLQQQMHAATTAAHALALLMLMHGTRIGETRQARWSDFDFDRRLWTIPARTTKTGAALVLPLTDQAIGMLLAYRAAQGGGSLLFPGHDGPITDTTAGRWIRAMSAGAWSAHDLRKLARTSWADLGVDYMVGELLLNHALTGLDRAYIHTYASAQMLDALQKYHGWLADSGVILSV